MLDACAIANHRNKNVRQRKSLENVLARLKEMNQATFVEVGKALNWCKPQSAADQVSCSAEFARTIERLRLDQVFLSTFEALRPVLTENLAVHYTKLRNARRSNAQIWADWRRPCSLIVPGEAVQVLVDAGDDKVDQHPSQVADVLQKGGDLGMRMYGHAAKGSLESCLNNVMQKWTVWMSDQPMIDQEVLDSAYEGVTKDLGKVKFTSNTCGRHPVALTFQDINCSLIVKGNEEEWNFLVPSSNNTVFIADLSV